jgi:hypothetical protein
MNTTVISVRGRKPAELELIPGFVYVGRSVPRSGWKASPFANPWRAAPDYPVEKVVADFEREILGANDSCKGPFTEMKRRLPELRGKVLGCWCCDWDGKGKPSKPCHAVVLAKLADGPLGEPKLGVKSYA